MNKILILVILSICLTTTGTAKNYRSKLDKAWIDKTYTDELIKELEKKQNEKTQGYLAVAYIMKSNHAKMPWSKLKYFYKGKRLLEKSISENPSNIELIYYRYEIQSRIPKGLNYNHMEKDVVKLKSYLSDINNKKQDLELYNQVKKTLNTKT